jgi:hypothetical protein
MSAYLGGHPESLTSVARFCIRMRMSLEDCSKQLAPENTHSWWQAADELRSSRLFTFLQQQDQLDPQARRLLYVLCMLDNHQVSEEMFLDSGMRQHLGISNGKLRYDTQHALNLILVPYAHRCFTASFHYMPS